MKKLLKIIYIFAVIGILGFISCREFEYLKEAEKIHKEKEEKKELLKKEIDENYISRKEDFYKKDK